MALQVVLRAVSLELVVLLVVSLMEVVRTVLQSKRLTKPLSFRFSLSNALLKIMYS